MENTTNSPQDSANRTSLVCPDPAHDDLTLDSEWSDEERDCVGDGPHCDGRDDREDRDDPENPDDFDEVEGQEVHAMNMRDHSMMILPLEDEFNIEAGKEIMWMEALGRYKITRDH